MQNEFIYTKFREKNNRQDGKEIILILPHMVSNVVYAVASYQSQNYLVLFF